MEVVRIANLKECAGQRFKMWYLQQLLIFKEEIKSLGDIESDEFNDLLLVEMKIKELYNKHFLSDKELDILDLYSKYKQVSRMKSRNRKAERFDALCKKLSLILGGIFTDEGYLEYMQAKYNLSDQDVKRLEVLITSNQRNRQLEII